MALQKPWWIFFFFNCCSDFSNVVAFLSLVLGMYLKAAKWCLVSPLFTFIILFLTLILEQNVVYRRIPHSYPFWIWLPPAAVLSSSYTATATSCTEVNDASFPTAISHFCSQWNSIFFTVWQCIWPHLLLRIAWLLSHREWHDMVANLKEPFFKNFFQGENCILQLLPNWKCIWQKNCCKNSCYRRTALSREVPIAVDAFKWKKDIP